MFCETGDGVRPCSSTVGFSVPNFLKGVNRISDFRVYWLSFLVILLLLARFRFDEVLVDNFLDFGYSYY